MIYDMTDAELQGAMRAADMLGVDIDDVIVKKAANDILDNSYEMQKLYSTVGAIILEKAGMQNTVQHDILCKCASANRVLSKETQEMYIKPVEDVLCKSAAMGKAVGALWGTLSATPALLLALSVGAGGLGGAGIYALQRAIHKDDAETEAKYRQAKIYRDAAKAISDKMNKNTKLELDQALF